MTTERFSSAGGAGEDSSNNLVERFKEALLEQHVDEFGACIDELNQALEGGKDAGDALAALVNQIRRLYDFHEAELRAWAEEDPMIKLRTRQFCIWLAQVYDLDIDLEEEE